MRKMICYVAVLFLSAIVTSSCSKDEEDKIENWDSPVSGLSESNLTHGYWNLSNDYKVKFYPKGKFEFTGNGDYYGTYKLNKEERCITFEYGMNSKRSDNPLNDKILNVSIVDGSLAFVNAKGNTVVLENRKEVLKKASLLGKKYRIVFDSGKTFNIKFDNINTYFESLSKDQKEFFLSANSSHGSSLENKDWGDDYKLEEFDYYNPYDYSYCEIEDGGKKLYRKYSVSINGEYISQNTDYGQKADYDIGHINDVRNDTIFGRGFKMYIAK